MAPMQGILDTHKYSRFNYPFFTSGDLSSHKVVLFIGGLTNGIGDVSYIPRFSEELGKVGWKLVQMHWTSAYDGYGTGSLDRDVQEMSSLIQRLRELGNTTIIIMGHSTGSQDIMHYLTTSSPPYETRTAVEGGIMQAPVSDRQYIEYCAAKPPAENDGWGKMWLDALEIAVQMRESERGEGLLPLEWNRRLGMRFTADRLFSLYGVGGQDDYFSTDIPIDPSRPGEPSHIHPLSETFAKLPVPSLAVYSKNDQFAPGHEKWRITETWKAVSDAGTGMLDTLVVEGNHGIDDEGLQEVFAKRIMDWLNRF